jgi:hypothetical protein
MQIYVSKDDQQYGPYAVEQLLEYVQQGNFTAEDLACHDGKNWVKVADVPGFAEATQPAATPSPTTPQRDQAVQENAVEQQPASADASNQSPAEPPDAKPAQVGKIDLDDPETRKKIVAKAVRGKKLQFRGKEGEELAYAPNQQKPYTGWKKWIHDNGHLVGLSQFKNGKLDGLEALWYSNGQKKGEVTFWNDKKDGLQTWWYENGQKKEEVTYRDGKLITAVGWKPNGEKCPVTNVKDGNGVWVYYNEDGTVERRVTYREGEIVSD